jgi:protein polybromo-1
LQDPSIQGSVESLKYLVVTKNVHRDTGAAEGKEEGGEGEEGEGGGSGNRIRRRFDLAKIRQWINDGRYTRLQQLQDDLLAVFKLGRKYYGSKAYYESFELERAYLRVRDEVCKDGNLLWSPALDYTARYIRVVVCLTTYLHT